MKSVVISLQSAAARREHIEKEFGKQKVDFDFFDALTPDLAKPLAAKMQLNFQDDFLTPGELACFMSHVSLWQKMVDENISHMAIFEDDVFLGKDADLVLNHSTWIKPDWDIIKIEAFASKILRSNEAIEIPSTERKVFQLKGKNLGTAGYILSLNGAKKYLGYIKHIQLIPLDELMFKKFVENSIHPVFQMEPAVAIQEMMLYPETRTVLSSDLLAERKVRMRQQKRKGWAKLQFEILRVFNQLKYVLVGKNVGFK
jgi:glycosyl transferase, family 25